MPLADVGIARHRDPAAGPATRGRGDPVISRQTFDAGRLRGATSFFSASSIRDCHPGPVALKCRTTSGDRRSESGTLVGALRGPRSPGRRSFAPFQNARTALGSFGSYARSGSTTRFGAPVRSRFQSLASAGNRFAIDAKPLRNPRNPAHGRADWPGAFRRPRWARAHCIY